ncbi:hypothetical protein SAMN05421676_103239 [Salinibacillus kushneri]|uniref:YfhD-like protein n=1 Tax=Salinibacillus kushneri TaxID=237682 RepID=A0A1I0CP45_9BACI|nr:hypothetical protein [Salinibacillus kushneri]SET21368.1 hypothetical protein SAMN05421676_103239 [Salinibacillus kushneri]
MTKRKTAYDAAKQNNKTPAESTPNMEFSAEYTDEDAMKGFNRNSKKGRKGKGSRGVEKRDS